MGEINEIAYTFRQAAQFSTIPQVELGQIGQIVYPRHLYTRGPEGSPHSENRLMQFAEPNTWRSTLSGNPSSEYTPASSICLEVEKTSMAHAARPIGSCSRCATTCRNGCMPSPPIKSTFSHHQGFISVHRSPPSCDATQSTKHGRWQLLFNSMIKCLQPLAWSAVLRRSANC